MSIIVNTNSYVSLTEAETYFEDAIHASNWFLEGGILKSKALVTATRMLEREIWAGSKTVSTQTLSFPRTDLIKADGTIVDSSTIPQEIKDAQCELALALINDSTIQSNATTGSNIKRVDAGGVEVEFFQPTKGFKFPTIVQKLVGQFLGSAAGSGITGSYEYGAGEDSNFCNYNLDKGFY